MVREQYPVLAAEVGDARLGTEVGRLAARTFEMSEFLVRELGVEDVGGSFPGRVALHTPCHSIRGINVGSAPEKLLRATKGLELVDLPRRVECCGFGGTFSVKNPETSLAMLSDKIEAIRDSGAQVLTAVDNSCLMHVAGGLHRAGLLWEGESILPSDGTIRVLHLAEILSSRGRVGAEAEAEVPGVGPGGAS
jgi:L-lactate dehydrogenase complex protein LldE